MKIKYLYITFVVLIALSIFSGLFVGDVSRGHAQSSRVWSDPINLSNSGASSEPMMVVDTLGVIHALWNDKYDGYRYVQSADGKAWTSPQKVKFPFVSGAPSSESKIFPPILLAAPRGFIHVFWQNLEKALVFAQAHSGNFSDPTAWGFQNKLSLHVLVFDAIVDPQGVVHVAYIRDTDSELGPAGVYYVRSLDEGKTWSTEKLLYESQYFRTTKPDVAHIRVVTSSEAGGQKVFVTWDNTSLKRIFMASSVDSGIAWADAIQLKGPEDTGGNNMAFNADMSVVGDKLLLVWKAGEPDANQCAIYSQLSMDNGITWGGPSVVISDRSVCPQDVDFLVKDEDFIVAMLGYSEDNPALIAWNGVEWSDPQIQGELSYFSDPMTRETILLGSVYGRLKGDQLFLIGSDLGVGGDVWMTSRPIVPVNDWAFSASLWSLPEKLTSAKQRIPFLIYVSDKEYMHALWSQSPITKESDLTDAIYYSRWNGSEWIPARNAIYGLSGTADELSVVSSDLGRLFIVWSDEKNGDLLFSWANSSKANSSSEWENPRSLPSPSQLTSSPDILIDASGRIVVLYAVPLNEKRGIYIIESTDDGISWSKPGKVFDAESSGWVMVDHPKIALTGDGRLHILFNKYSGVHGQSDGLYYVQSLDGGLTWSTPDAVSEGDVVWSDIVAPDASTVHRVWQENDESIVVNNHQASIDGGSSWGKVINITGVSDVIMPVALASNNTGNLHFIQMTQKDTPSYLRENKLIIRDWMWNGTQWESQPSQEISIKGERARFSIAAGISSAGYVSVSLLAEYYDLDGELKNEIHNIGRSISGFDVTKKPFLATITNPDTIPVSVETAVVTPRPSPVLPTSFPELSNDEPPLLDRNIAGILIVLLIIVLAVFLFIRRTKKVDGS